MTWGRRDSVSSYSDSNHLCGLHREGLLLFGSHMFLVPSAPRADRSRKLTSGLRDKCNYSSEHSQNSTYRKFFLTEACAELGDRLVGLIVGVINCKQIGPVEAYTWKEVEEHGRSSMQQPCTKALSNSFRATHSEQVQEVLR